MNQENEKNTECFCKKESFRKFLIVALGTFVGAFCALSLFSALHKPPMPPMPPMPPAAYASPYAYGHMHGHQCDCMKHKKMMMKKFMKHHENFKKPIEPKVPDTED